jgi:hypothetical protein
VVRRNYSPASERFAAMWARLPASEQRRMVGEVQAALREFGPLANADRPETHGPAPNTVHQHCHRHLDGTWRSELHNHHDAEHQAHVTAAAAAVPGPIYNAVAEAAVDRAFAELQENAVRMRFMRGSR